MVKMLPNGVELLKSVRQNITVYKSLSSTLSQEDGKNVDIEAPIAGIFDDVKEVNK